jgi:hypothetical protein
MKSDFLAKFLNTFQRFIIPAEFYRQEIQSCLDSCSPSLGSWGQARQKFPECA